MGDGTPWLTKEEGRAWRSFIEVTGRVLQDLQAGLKEASGMAFDDYEVLVHLSEAPERRLRMTQLSNRLIHSQSRLTQRIDRMVQRGWVYREKCDEDRRGTFACLTDAGFGAIDAAAPGHLQDVRRTFIDVIEPDELARLTEIFERVAENLRPAD